MKTFDFVVIAVLIILYVICFIIAHKMVKKRNMMAKWLLIGRDVPEVIDNLTNIAENVFAGIIISDKDNVVIEITQEDNEISKVIVKNKKTTVTLLKDGEKYVINNGLSEKGAIFILSLTLWACITMTFICVLFIIFAIISSHISFKC